MKRLSVIFLSLILLLSLGTVAFAAIDIGGNLRVLYQNGMDNDTFKFDRLALKFSSSLSAINGFKSEIRYTPLNGLKLVEGYYYQKNLFSNDEVQVGMIAIPSYNDKYVALQDTLGKTNTPANSVGIKYSYFSDLVDLSLAMANGKNESDINDKDTVSANQRTNGYDYGVRVSVKPIGGLTVSVAYDTNSALNDTKNDTLLVDTLYIFQAFSLFAEYVSYTPDSDDAKTGFYIEPSYKISDQIKIYAGTTVGVEDSGIPVKANGTSTSCDYQVGGVIFAVHPKTAIQIEYANYNDPLSKNLISARLKVDF